MDEGFWYVVLTWRVRVEVLDRGFVQDEMEVCSVVGDGVDG